jgi:hypothetical protein
MSKSACTSWLREGLLRGRPVRTMRCASCFNAVSTRYTPNPRFCLCLRVHAHAVAAREWRLCGTRAVREFTLEMDRNCSLKLSIGANLGDFFRPGCSSSWLLSDARLFSLVLGPVSAGSAGVLVSTPARGKAETLGCLGPPSLRQACGPRMPARGHDSDGLHGNSDSGRRTRTGRLLAEDRMVRPAAGGHASDPDSEACSATGTVRPHISYMRATDSVARSVTVTARTSGMRRVPAPSYMSACERPARPPMPNARPAHWQDRLRLGLLTPARAVRGSVVFLALTY